MNTLLAFVLTVAFGVRFWALMNPGEATLGLALVGALLALEGMILLVVRPGVLSNYALWKREKDAWNDDNQRVYGDWKLVKGLFRFWRARLTVRWADMGIWPEFTHRWVEWLDWRSIKRPVLHSDTVYGTRQEGLERLEKYHHPEWTIGEAQYALTYRPWEHNWRTALRVNWTPIMRVLWHWGRATLVIFAIVGFILGPLPWLAGFFKPGATPAPTVIAPTSAPLPTATPEVEVVQPQGADVLVIDLDRDAPPGEVWDWLNDKLAGIPGPDIPVGWKPPQWLRDLFLYDVAVIRLPEGMGGYVLVNWLPTTWKYETGLQFRLVNNYFQQIGDPVAVDTDEATVRAGDLQWGVAWSFEKGWDRLTRTARGQVYVIVNDRMDRSIDPVLLVGDIRWYEKVQWWHWTIGGALLLLIGYAIYRRLKY